MTESPLFDGFNERQPDPSKLTAGERRRLRNDRLIESGYHPLAFTARFGVLRLLTPVGEHTCGDCAHRQSVNAGTARDFPKCMHPDGRRTRSITTDCRASWPACVDWEAKA